MKGQEERESWKALTLKKRTLARDEGAIVPFAQQFCAEVVLKCTSFV
jgi:hypothetical protein